MIILDVVHYEPLIQRRLLPNQWMLDEYDWDSQLRFVGSRIPVPNHNQDNPRHLHSGPLGPGNDAD